MSTLTGICLDSNVLIYSLNQDSHKSTTADTFIRSIGNVAVITQQNLLETYRIITHPNFPSPLPQQQALEVMEVYISQFKCLSPTTLTENILFSLLEKYKITGTKIFDLYLVATMLTHNIQVIATDNIKDFEFIEEITVINPFD